MACRGGGISAVCMIFESEMVLRWGRVGLGERGEMRYG